MDDDPSNDLTPDQWLAAHPAPDDSGARTQSSFRFQHECTARLCAPLFVKRNVVSVVCEEHEDCVVFYERERPQLVSIKHRAGTRGAWSFATLLTDGGVTHLYERWVGTGKRASCLLMTNGALRPGQDEAAQFAAACHTRDPEVCRPWAERLASELEVDSTEAEVFLLALSIESGLPGREHIAAVNVRELIIPALEELGLQPTLAEDCYERLIDAIARANRDAVGDRIDLVDVIADPGRLDAAAETNRRLTRRSINRELAAQLLAARASEATLLAGGNVEDPPPASRLQQKLERGGLGPTAVNSAINLRASWYAFERSRRLNIPGGDSVFEDLRLRVQELVSLSESRTRATQAYGSEMHVDVRESVTPGALGAPPPFPLDEQLLQGLIFQLTDECAIWWSEPFDVDVEAAT